MAIRAAQTESVFSGSVVRRREQEFSQALLVQVA
jgi:hypothetical protein